ncbi:telomerase RNA component interacting RNase isoform X1 [Gouania willdenowi]|uniref:telomerase RNA component interacting RNase isoform X1 n=2 Tax=Gouania willdenowi TaxID=441366 RepID=UPI001055B019|nr:telomerase RNA component interacting RNase isoform X1 [Gouania willdenowi]
MAASSWTVPVSESNAPWDPMDSHSKAHPGGASGSSGESGCDSPASPSSSPVGGAGAAGGNVFANDGSFMEMFKKKMEEQQKNATEKSVGETSEHGQTASVAKKAPPTGTSFVGKRRGGVFLKTGMVAKKQKQDSEKEPGKSDAWSKYMAEVKKYKAHQCGDDDKTRPLVK